MRLIIAILKYIKKSLSRAACCLKYSTSNYGVEIDPTVIIRVRDNCTFKVGSSVEIGAFTIIDLAVGEGLSERTELTIGSNTYIGDHNNIRATGYCSIGSDCLISQGVSIIGANHLSERERPIKYQDWDGNKVGFIVEDDVWIGANATIMPGIVVMNGSIIAAGAVLTKNTEKFGIYAGVPAVKIGARK